MDAELSLPAGSASIPAMLFGKLALFLLAVFGVALVVRFALSFRSFQHRYDESVGEAEKRFRQQLGESTSLPGGTERPRTR